MAKLEQLNLPSYNYESSVLSEFTQEMICIGCQAKERKLIKLKDCKHSSIFEYIRMTEVDKSSAMVCYMCHGLIKKFHDFKTQIETSLSKLKILNDILSQPVTDHELTNLKFSNIELNSTVDSKPVEFESMPFPVQLNIEMETVVKIEHESYSDTEHETAVIGKRKPAKKSRPSIEAKYEGKIKLIILSMEEMLLERKDDALKNGYLNLPFKCDKCITGFDHELTLKDHIEKRHVKKKGGFTCDICESVLSTRTSFDEHNKRHYRRYECAACYKRYNNVYSVLKHYNELHGRINTHFACKMCDYTTESHRSYRYHLDKHRSAKVECAECGSTFVNKTGLRMHMFTIHAQSSRVYACDQCGKRYRAKSGLAAHAATHAATPPAYCAPCRTHFRTQLGLRHHLKTHSKHVADADKRFTCDDCGLKFLSKSSLQEHADWVHLNNTKHACTKCSKVFKNSSSLKKHKEFVHEKKRPPRNKICDHCGRGFTTLSILQAHIRTHTGERPLRCARCPASFAHSAALYTHNKLLHAASSHPVQI